jgi:hypothetical protein
MMVLTISTIRTIAQTPALILTSRQMEDQILTQRHEPNSTSQWMEDLYDTQDRMTQHN